MKIGFIGLGNMGAGMAHNLLKAGHQLKVYNRTQNRTERLRAAGAEVAGSPAQAATGVDALITMLADDQAIKSVMNSETLDALPKGAIHVSMSTIGVATSEKLAQIHARKGQAYVAAPVFGRPDAAEAANLVIVAAGPRDATQKCAPLFAAMGQRTFNVGENPVAANVVKLSGNFLLACIIESMGEAVALVRKYGLDPAEYVQFLTSTLFSAPPYKIYGDLISHEKYQPAGFRVQLGFKDIRLAQNAAEAASVPMPFAGVLRDKFISAVAHGMNDWDWSAIALVTAQQAGLRSKT